jgi:hypothetical protein
VGLGEKKKERVVQSDIPARESNDSVEDSGSWEDGDTAGGMYPGEDSNTDESSDAGESGEDIENTIE